MKKFFVICSVFIGKARRLETARTISLGGEASGSITFDGSQNETLTVTLDNDALDDQYIRLDGTTQATASILPAVDDTHDLGSTTNKWKLLPSLILQILCIMVQNHLVKKLLF